MRSLNRISLGLAVAYMVLPTAVHAQSRVGAPTLKRPNRPVVSPYLNLAAAGGNPDAVAFQYYNRVLPDASFRRAANQGAAAVRDLDTRLAEQKKALQQSQTSALSATGHRTQFMNYGGYFPNKK